MDSRRELGRIGKFSVCTRRDVLSSHAGIVLLKEFVEHLQVASTLDAQLHVKCRERGHSESTAILGLVYNLVLGGQCLSDLEVLRGDLGTQRLLDLPAILAPTTAGEWLRKFNLGDIYDLQRVNRLLQERVRPQQARYAPAGASASVYTIDVDSSIYEQASTHKQGSCKAYNGEIGYHPLLAFCAETEELLLSHLRRGGAHTVSKATWFLAQVLQRVPAGKRKCLRADSGFYCRQVVAFCEQEAIVFAITADQTAPLLAAIAALAEGAWTDLEKYGVAQVGELRYRPTGWSQSYRYIIKRELRMNKQGGLYFHYHALVTNNDTDRPATVLAWHLQHADMENRIKEHKSGLHLEKFPTRSFHANWAYLLIGQIAYNLVVWFKRLVLPRQYHHATLSTLRHHLLNLAGKVVQSGRQWCLILNEHYRYQDVWRAAMLRLQILHCS